MTKFTQPSQQTIQRIHQILRDAGLPERNIETALPKIEAEITKSRNAIAHDCLDEVAHHHQNIHGTPYTITGAKAARSVRGKLDIQTAIIERFKT